MRKLYLILLIILVLMSISCVFASENTNETISDNSVNAHVDTTTAPTTINENKHVDNTPDSYDDLKTHIEQNIGSDDAFNLIKDYKVNAEDQRFNLNNRVIVINQDNIIINGNGHTIDAGGLDNFAIFNVLGNNVTITNLKLINSIPSSVNDPHLYSTKHKMISSPINWEGNNGVIKNCDFYNNCAVNGGSISWMGNNGTIDNCSFANSTAIGVGSAIYIGGTNNTVSNCLFIKPNSLLGESIYMGRNRKNIIFKNNTLSSTENKSSYIIDGAVSNIDVNYLQYSHKINAFGNFTTCQSYNVDIIPLLFKVIMLGGTNSDGRLKYNAIYNNKTGDFTFNILGHEIMFTGNQSPLFEYNYIKSIHFESNITDFNQVFSEICHKNYKYDITQLITGYIYNAQDYENINQIAASGLWFKKDEGYTTLINALKIVFISALTINSDNTWNPKDKGFDVISIMGNGSTINGGAGDRDEKKFIVMNDPNVMIIVNELTIKGFNTAVECLQGTCYFNNVNFNHNRMNYYFDRDWGAGILNSGKVFCNNCTFTENYAKNGGAIFNQGYLSLDNCIFGGNTAYGVGNHVCVGDGGNVVVNGKNITSNTDIIYFAESMSTYSSVFFGAVSIIASFFTGMIFGALTGPVGGASIGFLIGGGIGGLTSSDIISQHYDINYNRELTCALVFGGSALAGAVGGLLGGCLFHEKYIYKQEPDKLNKLLTKEDKKGSFVSSDLAKWEHIISSN